MKSDGATDKAETQRNNMHSLLHRDYPHSRHTAPARTENGLCNTAHTNTTRTPVRRRLDKPHQSHTTTHSPTTPSLGALPPPAPCSPPCAPFPRFPLVTAAPHTCAAHDGTDGIAGPTPCRAAWARSAAQPFSASWPLRRSVGCLLHDAGAVGGGTGRQCVGTSCGMTSAGLVCAHAVCMGRGFELQSRVCLSTAWLRVCGWRTSRRHSGACGAGSGVRRGRASRAGMCGGRGGATHTC